VALKVLLCVLVATQNVIREAIDLDVAANWEVSWCDKNVIVVNILVLIATKERTFNNARVFLRWFID